MHKLTILDPETELQYTLLLDNEDYLRSRKDQQFLSSLLHHAKNGDDPEASTSKEAEDTNTCVVENENAKINYAWTYNQVTELIKSMCAHMEDMNHPKKRKLVFEHVANDLISMQFDVTPIMIQNKWNSLLKSYRKAKDTKTRTGRAPSRFNFFDLLDDILGSNPTNSCPHSVNSNGNNTPETSESSLQSETSDDQHEVKKISKVSQNILKRDLIEFKREESTKKQKRHDERLAVEREKINLENKKLELPERYLQTKRD